MTSEANRRAAAAKALGRTEEVERLAREGLQHDPADADLLGLLADALASTRLGKEAVEVAERAIALQPEDPELLRTYVFALLISSRDADAVDAARAAVAVNPHDPKSLYLLFLALDSHARRKLRPSRKQPLLLEAERIAQELVRAQPHVTTSHLALAEAQMKLDRLAEAEAILTSDAGRRRRR